MPKYVPYLIILGVFVVALFLLQIRDRSYLEGRARSLYPAPPASRVILPPTQELLGQLLFVNGDRVAFRKGPSLQDQVVDRFFKGRTVRQTEVKGEWVYVWDAETGRKGWVAGQYLTPTDPQKAIPPTN